MWSSLFFLRHVFYVLTMRVRSLSFDIVQQAPPSSGASGARSDTKTPAINSVKGTIQQNVLLCHFRLYFRSDLIGIVLGRIGRLIVDGVLGDFGDQGGGVAAGGQLEA